MTPFYVFSIAIKLLTLKLIVHFKLTVLNNFINMKKCSSDNINRDLIQ